MESLFAEKPPWGGRYTPKTPKFVENMPLTALFLDDLHLSSGMIYLKQDRAKISPLSGDFRKQSYPS
jgi:hypothetical protein